MTPLLKIVSKEPPLLKSALRRWLGRKATSEDWTFKVKILHNWFVNIYLKVRNFNITTIEWKCLKGKKKKTVLGKVWNARESGRCYNDYFVTTVFYLKISYSCRIIVIFSFNPAEPKGSLSCVDLEFYSVSRH